ncbi:MAG: GNAT family N-acetyltransferase [Eubacteriales bacterium]
MSGDVTIARLDRNQYAGKKFSARYLTRGYYDTARTAEGFSIVYKPLEVAVEKELEDSFFSPWLEDPSAFGAFLGGELLGFAEGSPETWNQRYRISNICIFQDQYRRRGIGQRLMDAILEEAERAGARMAVLETQSCNENAIAFYRKNGFDIIGLDLYAYSNYDPEWHEVRFEMGKIME